MSTKPKTEETTGEVQQVEARVLCDCWLGSIDSIVTLEPKIAAAAYRAGYIDTHPAAIAAVRSA